MSDNPVELHFQKIRQQMTLLQSENPGAWQEIDAVLEDLHVVCEAMQTHLELAAVVEEELLQQTQHLTQRCDHYYELFQSLCVAYLVSDADGIILEANQAIAQLLNVPHPHLVGKPLVLYVAEDDRSAFRIKLNQLSQNGGTQVWQIRLRPREGQLLTAQLHITATPASNGLIERLQIGVYNVSPAQTAIPKTVEPTSPTEVHDDRLTVPPLGRQPLEERAEKGTLLPQLPQSLDGLRVLLVDDEADIREFVTAVLESYGIGVRAVASAAAALEELDRFQPDVLISDIRMPSGDGYSLIRQIRALEAERGRHLPAAAITAYIDEDQEKSLKAGYEMHLYKLAQPREWIETVAQLAGHASSLKFESSEP